MLLNLEKVKNDKIFNDVIRHHKDYGYDVNKNCSVCNHCPGGAWNNDSIGTTQVGSHWQDDIQENYYIPDECNFMKIKTTNTNIKYIVDLCDRRDIYINEICPLVIVDYLEQLEYEITNKGECELC